MSAYASAPTRATAIGTIGNVLWLFFGGGVPLAVGYALGALVLCLTIVGIPLGVQVFKLAWYALLPFDKRVVDDTAFVGGTLSFVLNVLWFVFFGLWLALAHLSLALASAITVVGIPFAVAHWKLAWLAVRPFGKDVI